VDAPTVVREGHDGPLSGHGPQAAQVETQEAHGVPDDAEDGLHGLLAPFVESLIIGCLQLGLHVHAPGFLDLPLGLDGRRWPEVVGAVWLGAPEARNDGGRGSSTVS
jgi:hypothetical protein